MSNFDEALERFHLADLEYAGGRASHGPMGIEALECLGHQALIPAFLDLYVPRLPPAVPGRAMSPTAAEAALGHPARAADWVATYEARLAGGDWREVLSAALPDLLPGLFAGAGHGLLRTAHAARSLEREDSLLRRRELARGLAFWSARFQRLPGLPGSLPAEGATLEDFFAALPALGVGKMRGELFTASASQLESEPAFARAIEAQPRPGFEDVSAFLNDLCRIGVRLYCLSPEVRVAYVHLVTIPNAVIGLLPYVTAAEHGQAALFALQSVGALVALHHCGEGDGTGPVTDSAVDGDCVARLDDEVRGTASSWDEIRYRAACSIQEHAIKMAEACLRCDERTPDPLFRFAAADAALRIEGALGSAGC